MSSNWKLNIIEENFKIYRGNWLCPDGDTASLSITKDSLELRPFGGVPSGLIVIEDIDFYFFENKINFTKDMDFKDKCFLIADYFCEILKLEKINEK